MDGVLVSAGSLRPIERIWKYVDEKTSVGQFFYFYEEPLVPVLKNKLEKFWFWFHM
jgi:hypothetical protein